MRADRGSYNNAESQRRSGYKQSRTKRKERFERRELLRGQTEREPELRFGILLQGEVAKKLSRMGVPHHPFDYRSAYAQSERVELAVLDRIDGEVIAEVQFTLRRGIRGKIKDFLRAATVRATQDVPRIYLEIEDHVGHSLKAMAERVAYAIRDIVEEIEDWMDRAEQGNTIGLALVLDHDRRTRIFPMRLMSIIGSRARRFLADLLNPPSLETQAMSPDLQTTGPESQASHTAVEPTSFEERKPVGVKNTRPIPFLNLFYALREQFRGFTPHPSPVFAGTQRNHPLRMPFRR